MTLLVVSYAYPPLRYPRAIQVARLVAHLPPDEVVVVCAEEPGSGDQTLLDAYPDRDRKVVRVPWSAASRGIRRLRSATLADRLLVPDIYRPWQRDAARAIRQGRLLQPGDVLATFGQPMSDHLLGLRLATRVYAPWIAHFSDPWLDSPFRTGGRLTELLNSRLERRVVATADAVVVTSTDTAELFRERYGAVIEHKLHVVPHAFDATLYRAADKPREGTVVRYIGNFYGHRRPEPLFDALRVLLERDPAVLDGVRLELVGSTEHPVNPEALAGLPEGLVLLRGPVDYLESLALAESSDLLLVLDAPARHSVFLPSKLIDYLGSGTPILALTPPGAATDLVRRVGGWHSDPHDPSAAADVLASSLAAVRADTSRDPRSFAAADEYASPAVAARFRDVIGAARTTADRRRTTRCL